MHIDDQKGVSSSVVTVAEPESTMLEGNNISQSCPENFHNLSQHHSEMEKRVVRKLDCRIVPLLASLYLLSFLDRSNIGNARIAGMEEDLELTGGLYDWLLTIFYIAYITFEFQGMMWKILPPHVWASFVVFAWGVVATCQAGVNSWTGAMICRFLLGAAEAGYGPSVPYLLSFYYRRHELGFRVGMFLAAAPLANAFAGALAYAITSGNAAMANWRLLFLVEGLPTVAMAPVVWFFLAYSPEQARFLSEEEKVVAKARAVRQVGVEQRHGSLNWRDVRAAFLDLKCWITAVMFFSCNVSFASLPVFLPTILTQMGFSAIASQGLTAPPYLVSFVVTIATTWTADRLQERGLMVTLLSVVGGLGYVLLAACGTSVAVRYLGVFLAASGIFPAIANILPWVVNNQGSDTRRGVSIVILNLVGQCGPLLGSRIYPDHDSPRYVEGMSICAAFMLFNAALALALRALLVQENRQMDRRYGSRIDRNGRRPPAGAPSEGEATEKEDGVSYAEENYGPGFRNIL